MRARICLEDHTGIPDRTIVAKAVRRDSGSERLSASDDTPSPRPPSPYHAPRVAQRARMQGSVLTIEPCRHGNRVRTTNSRNALGVAVAA